MCTPAAPSPACHTACSPGSQGGDGVDLQARVVRLQHDRLAVDGQLQRLVQPVVEGRVQLLHGLVAGAAADLDTEHGGALGYVGAVHQQAGAVGDTAEEDHAAA